MKHHNNTKPIGGERRVKFTVAQSIFCGILACLGFYINLHQHLVKRYNNSDNSAAIAISSTIQSGGGVKCNDNNECNGHFNYSGPNHDIHEATKILMEEAKLYTYGNERNTDGHMIFFPNHTNSVECIDEWEKAGNNKFTDHGMSSWKEDMIIFKKFFNNSSLGSNYIYMEIGAHDGVRESNTRFFDVCLGWQGLLVEPHPFNYGRMEKLRPNAHHLNVAPSCTNTSDVVSFPNHIYTSAVANEEGNMLEIHCGPLSYYLEQLGIQHIDFWSLDVEGSELNLLKTVDFKKVHIDIIMAESVNRLKGKEQMGAEVRAYLQEKGYVVFPSNTIHKSDVFLHKRVCHRYAHLAECRDVINITSSV